MNDFRFTSFLTSNVNTDQKELDLLLAQCQMKSFKKGEFLLQPGKKCSHTFFVERGLLRQYTVDDKGKEHIIQFAPENWFMTDRESVFFNQPSDYYIQALENTDVFLIEEDFFTQLSLADPSFLAFNNKLLHNHIRHLQKRINMLLSATAEERYLYFIQVYPDLLLRVSQVLIASYLGIVPESLSRIRREMANKHPQKTILT